MSTVASRVDGSDRGRGEEGGQPLEARLAEGLGWLSMALGVPQTFAPGRFAEAIGVEPDPQSRVWTLIVGLRELAAAGGILSARRPVGWLWARVGGDAMDLALLTYALGNKRERPVRIMAAMGVVAGTAVADLFTAIQMTRKPEVTKVPPHHHVRASATVRRPLEEVYAFWHNFANLPMFMGGLESVVLTGDRRSRWKARSPLGGDMEWDALIVEDIPNELIAWASVKESDVETAGTVRFVPAPGGRGTEIELDMEYAAAPGPVSAVAKLLGEEPSVQVKDDLRRFKQVMETGEVVRSDGTPEGPFTPRLLRQRPAQPPENVGELIGGRT